jgi:RHS repeat-associated protein
LYTTDVLTAASSGNKGWNGIRESFGKTNVQPNVSTSYLMRFPGQWEDGVGYVANWYRTYKNLTGGFLEQDIVDISLGWRSVYIYSLANPIIDFDISGRFSTLEYCRNPKHYEVCVEIGAIPRKPAPEAVPKPQPTPKPVPKPLPKDQSSCPKCGDDYPTFDECFEIAYDYPFWSEASALSNFPGGKLEAKVPATGGVCTQKGWHARIKINGVYRGSIFSCKCCDDTFGSPQIREYWGTNVNR